MDIKVSLPKPEDVSGKDIKKFLRQMELAIHHLQKSVEQIELEGDLNEDVYIVYRFPKINLYSRESDNSGHVKVHVDEEADEMQEIEVAIVKS